MSSKIVGIDLDNTLIDYSQAVRVYSSQNLEIELTNIAEIRREFKIQKNNAEWRRAQSWIYTEGLTYARLSEGAVELLSKLDSSGINTYVISHKTNRTPEEFGGKELRTPAKEWIRNNLNSQGIDSSTVFFESTRAEKIQRVKDLGITHFVDDLIEVFTDKEFPKNAIGYLYSPFVHYVEVKPNITVIRNLNEI